MKGERLRLIIKFLTKQKQLGLWPGAFYQMYTGATVYQGLVNTFVILATGYNTTLRVALQVYVPWLNFWLFLAVLIAGNLFTMLLHWKYVFPSQVVLGNRQAFYNPNPSIELLKDIQKRLERIEEKQSNESWYL